MYADTSKMKILGVECYGIMMPKTAEPPQTILRSHKASRDGDIDGTPYATATRTATCTSVTSIGTTTSGTGTTTGSTTTGTTTIPRLCAQLPSFLAYALWHGRVLFR